jgi:formate/nitrite transporter FocA (FNT family)
VTGECRRDRSTASEGRPQPEYLKAVSEQLAAKGQEHLHQRLGPALISAALAGAFVTFGALLSVLLSAGIKTEGVTLLIQGLAFAVGYYFIALAGVALFTEANVSLPDVLLQCHKRPVHLARFWSLTFLFNFLGAFLVGWAVYLAQNYSPEVRQVLADIVEAKMSYRERGGPGGWFAVVLSAMLANWMVGLAFFFATMAQNVWSKFVPLALAVLLFEAANFQHSPANMAFFSLVMPGGGGPGCGRCDLVEPRSRRCRQHRRRRAAGRRAVLVRGPQATKPSARRRRRPLALTRCQSSPSAGQGPDERRHVPSKGEP